MFDRLRRLLRIEPSEFVLIRTLFTLHFLIITAFTLGKTVRDGLYLEQLPARSLPLVYLGMAVWTALAVWLCNRLTRGLASHRSLATVLLFASGSLVLFFFAFRWWREVAAIAFYLWSGAVGLLLVSQFWIVANERSDSRQARRLFGTVGAGGIAGGLFGGGLASLLGTIVGSEPLLLLTALFYVLAVPLALQVGPAAGAARLPVTALADEGSRAVMSRPYLRLVAGLFLVAGMAAAILDYQFKLTLQESMIGAGRMTAFLGSFYGAQNLVALFIQLGLTGLVLTRLGARAAAVALPVGLLAGVAAMFGAPGLIAVAATRLFESTMRISVSGTSWEFLYFPLPDSIRQKARRIIDLIVNRNAEAAAGLLILGVNMAFGGSFLQITIVLAVTVVAWLGMEFLMSRAYVRELSSSLKQMVVDARTAHSTLRETRVFAEVGSLLDSPYERQVLYAIDLLEQLDRRKLWDRIPAFLHHPSSRVRLRGIQLSYGKPEVVDLVDMEALLHDPDSEVRIHAALFFSRLTPGSPVDNMSDLLNSEDPGLRSSALSAVAEHSPPDDDPRVEDLAHAFLSSGSAADRLAVASAAGRRPGPSRLHRLIPKLIEDGDPAVRRAAIGSAGQAGRREFIPLLIERLVERGDREAARAALTAFGDRVIGTLGDYLVDPTIDRRVKRELPRVLAAIGTQEAADNLVRASFLDDLTLGYQVLKAMNRIRANNHSIEMSMTLISPQIRSEAEHMTRLLVRNRTLGSAPPSRARDLLLRLMAERADQALDRLFRRMALVYPPREMRLAYVGVTGGDLRVRAQSIEYMESILLPDDRRVVLPLIDTSPEDERVNNASSVFRMKSLSLAESVRDLASGNDAWLTACALYLAGTLELTSLRDLVSDSLRSPEILVRDTAAWASARLEA